MRTPILVTGSHRSGSTWVGKMIAKSPEIGYISEPFNPGTRNGICSAPFEHWFTYISAENESLYYDKIKECLEFKYQWNAEVGDLKSLKDMARLGMGLWSCAYNRFLDKRPLMKDPIALFSTEWLARKFDMKVIILIRHPAAFASSLKLKGWKYNFSNFLDQPLLMESEIGKFASEIKDYVKVEREIIDQAILLWNIIYHMVTKLKNLNTDWLFLRHEDVSLDPDGYYRKIFEYIDEDYSSRVRQRILDYSSPSNPSEQRKGIAIKRNSVANIWNWRNRLTDKEILRIREGTSVISDSYYSSDDWDEKLKL